MKKEDIEVLARLVMKMKEELNGIDKAIKNKDSAALEDAKKKILVLQAQADERI